MDCVNARQCLRSGGSGKATGYIYLPPEVPPAPRLQDLTFLILLRRPSETLVRVRIVAWLGSPGWVFQVTSETSVTTTAAPLALLYQITVSTDVAPPLMIMTSLDSTAGTKVMLMLHQA